jgi:hypothetical protein
VTRLSARERIALAPLARWTDLGRVRVYRGDDGAFTNLARSVVLSLSRDRACALGNHVFIPDRLRTDLAVLAHETAHCGQYQRWGALRYFARGSAEQARYTRWRRTGAGTNPYAYRAEPERPFGAYGMEQQGQLVEDAFRGDPRARRALGWIG